MEVQDIDFRMFARGVGDATAFKAGEVIFAQGSVADAIWIVLSGWDSTIEKVATLRSMMPA